MEDEIEGEVIDLGDDTDEVVDTDDGGAIVKIGDDDDDGHTDTFYENLCETLSESVLGDIAGRYLQTIERDKKAREKRDKQYEEGIKRTGLGEDAPGGAQFQGASKVVHPMITEGCVDFAARTMKELWPAAGPAKDFIIGNVTAAKVAKAKRKTALMNWQLTVQSTEARAELEQLLTQVPLGGAQYLKVSWDEKRNRPGFLFVAIDDMYLPYAATNFYSAQRKTHVQYLTQLDYEQRVKSGMYIDADLSPASMVPEGSGPQKANDKIEGREETSYNEDGLRTVFEIYTIDDIEDDGASPYILTVDKDTSTVLSIYRNWDELDETREELQWFVEYPFIPWRGAYPIGLPHMIGGLAAATTGSLRALLDSAHINNIPTMLKLKGTGIGGQSLEIQPTQILEVEGGLAVDDIRKVAMPLPFNQPSAVLYQLMGFLADTAKGVVRTSMDDIAENMAADTPVGTTLARMEQGMVVFSAVHGRLHDAMARMLRILHRLNGMYLDDKDIKAEVGEELATRADFQGPMDVVPVSDPNIFSEAQRYAQVQAVAARSDTHPGMYDARKVEELILKTLKIPGGVELLAPDTSPIEENAVNENVFASSGRPLLAFPRQDHIAHLKTHFSYMVNPVLGMSDLIAPTYLPIIIEHIKQHVAMWYGSAVRDMCNEKLGFDISEAKDKLKTDDEKRSFDRMLAEAALVVSEAADLVFAQLPEIIGQAQQLVAKYAEANKPPLDPAAQVGMANVQAQLQLGQMRDAVDKMRVQMDGFFKTRKLEMDDKKLQLTAQTTEAKLEQAASAVDSKAQTEALKQEHEDRRTAAEVDQRQASNVSDNVTAMKIAELETVSDVHTGLTDGSGINPGS